MNIEETLDAELRARKLSLSAETRRVCVTVIKAVLAQAESAVTPYDGAPIIRAPELTPEKKMELEKALREAGPHKVIVINDQPEIQLCPKHGEVMDDQGRCRVCLHAGYDPTRDL